MKVAFGNFAFCSLVLLFSAAIACSAQAQSSSSGCDSGHGSTSHASPRHSHRGFHFVAPQRYGYGYGYRPHGYDYRYGVAELVRAKATANVLNAGARTQHLHADRLEMDNSVQFLATRLERKQINSETRFGHLHARGEQVRQQKLATEAIVAQSPTRRAVDPVTGQVEWPILLRSSYYQKARGPVDLVFHQRSVVGQINPDHYLPLRDWIERIERELKANVAYYEMDDYLEAKAFLRNLVDEARIDGVPVDSTVQFASHH